jgi:hypothetical protein
MPQDLPIIPMAMGLWLIWILVLIMTTPSVLLTSPGLSFSDFTSSGGGFDVPGFASQDLGLSTAVTPASEPDQSKDQEAGGAKPDLPTTS